MFRSARREAFRQGVDAAVQDLLLLNSTWDISLGDVAIPVSWWHGALDPITPLDAVRCALDDITHPTLHELSGEGHAIGFVHASRILEALRT